MGEIELMPERKASGEEEDQDEGEERGNGKQGKSIKDEGKKKCVQRGDNWRSTWSSATGQHEKDVKCAEGDK